MNTKMVVGLGNPGEKYEKTRHNVGFLFVDYLVEKMDMPLVHEKKKTIYAKKTLQDSNSEIILLKPLTFSNLAMEAVLYIASFSKVSRENIFIVYDEINKPLGQCVYNPQKENIKHNGVLNLIDFFLSDDFVKCGIGIGKRPVEKNEKDFYLASFTETEEEKLAASFSDVQIRLDKFLMAKPAKTMLASV